MKHNRNRQKKRNTRYKSGRMKKLIIVLFLVVIVIMGGAILTESISWGEAKKDTLQENNTDTDSSNTQNTIESTIYYHQEIGKIESLLTETDQMIYSLHYPKFSQEKIDEDIYKLLKEMIMQAEKIAIPVEHPDMRSMLYMNYDSYLVGHNIASIIFYVEFSSPNLANPAHAMIEKHYEIKTGKCLTNDDLFRGKYREAIAEYCEGVIQQDEALAGMITKESIVEMLENDESLINISLAKDGVLLTFSKDVLSSEYKEYQITIPYEYMESYLKFDYKSETIEINDEEENDIDRIEAPVIDPEKPMIALTFDDGPNKSSTNRILDVLKKYNSRATFYVVGNRLRDHVSTLQRIIAENSEIGNHTYNHKSLALLSKGGMKKELAGVDDTLEEIVDETSSTIRPPYGAINDLVRSTLEQPMILWSVDTEDWKNRNTDQIVKNVMNNVHDGDIILFHDIYDTTAAAIEIIVPKLVEQGYQIVTVSEMFDAKGIKLQDGKVYFSAR